MSKPNLLVVCPPDHYVLRNLRPLESAADISVSIDPEELKNKAPLADAILYAGLAGKGVSLEDLWPYATRVKWVHSLSAGIEKLLFPALIESDVPVTNARGVFKRSLAEFAILGVLYFYKQTRRLVDNQRNHKWDNFTVEWLPDKIMGIVGYGEIGRECALLAKALGLKIYATRRNLEKSKQDPLLDKIFPPSELHRMLAEVDVLVAAAPLTPETHHMLSAAEFRSMKPFSIVVNVGRGPVIDEAALVQALQNGQVAAAALDVFEEEPLPANHPFWDMENVLISPHCTDRTRDPDWLDLSAQLFVENFHHFAKGEPLVNVVDKKAGY